MVLSYRILSYKEFYSHMNILDEQQIFATKSLNTQFLLKSAHSMRKHGSWMTVEEPANFPYSDSLGSVKHGLDCSALGSCSLVCG